VSSDTAPRRRDRCVSVPSEFMADTATLNHGEEGDVDVGETEKLGEPEHGVYVSLNWQREDEDMSREFWFLMIHRSFLCIGHFRVTERGTS
ncbi:unnamed protein product, partial [Ilex paraguariensis]